MERQKIVARGGVNNFKVTLLGIHTNIEGGRSMTNQIVNGSFEDGETGWNPWNGSITTEKASSGTHSLYIPSIAAWWNQQLVANNQDNIYYAGKFMSEVKNGPMLMVVNSSGAVVSPMPAIGPNHTFELTSYILKSEDLKYFQVGVCGACMKGNVYMDDMIAVNLTQTFGAGNELSKEEMDAIGWFDGTVSIASKTGNTQVDFSVSAETGYTISNRITCNSGYATFESGVVSIKGMNQDTFCRIESIP